MTANNKNEEDGIGLFTLLGKEGVRVYDTFTLGTEADAKKINPVIAKINQYFQPRKNQTFKRYKCFTRHQRSDESSKSFILALQSLIASFEFENQGDSILRDQIVSGVANSSTREKLLYDPQPTLQKAIDILYGYEVSASVANQMSAEAVHRLVAENSKPNGVPSSLQHPPRKPFKQSRESAEVKYCNFCGKSNKKGNCQIYGKTCEKGGKRNHLAKVLNERECYTRQTVQESIDKLKLTRIVV